MSHDDEDPNVDLAAAIKALRAALEESLADGSHSTVRFRADPVELTVNVAVTKSRQGTAGVKWHVISVGGQRERELASTQTLKLRLTPVLFDEDGGPLPEDEQLIADREEDPAP
jgi:hypothetical protein